MNETIESIARKFAHDHIQSDPKHYYHSRPDMVRGYLAGHASGSIQVVRLKVGLQKAITRLSKYERFSNLHNELSHLLKDIK